MIMVDDLFDVFLDLFLTPVFMRDFFKVFIYFLFDVVVLSCLFFIFLRQDFSV